MPSYSNDHDIEQWAQRLLTCVLKEIIYCTYRLKYDDNKTSQIISRRYPRVSGISASRIGWVYDWIVEDRQRPQIMHWVNTLDKYKSEDLAEMMRATWRRVGRT